VREDENQRRSDFAAGHVCTLYTDLPEQKRENMRIIFRQKRQKKGEKPEKRKNRQEFALHPDIFPKNRKKVPATASQE